MGKLVSFNTAQYFIEFPSIFTLDSCSEVVG